MDKSFLIADLQDRINAIEDSREAAEPLSVQAASAAKKTRLCERQELASEGDQSAFDRIIKLTATRDRSTLELKKRLVKEGFEPLEAEGAVSRATACNLVNDQRFAEQRIRGLLSKGKGLAGIERDLGEFGIEAQSIPGWPYEFVQGGYESEVDRALSLLHSKPSRSKNQLQGNYAKLIRCGYSPEVALRAAKSYTREQPYIKFV